VRQAMATCAGVVVSVSRGNAVDDFVATLIDMYNGRGAEDSAVRMCVALVFKECMVQAGDVMRDYGATVSNACMSVYARAYCIQIIQAKFLL
jgi:hypothetical protein